MILKFREKYQIRENQIQWSLTLKKKQKKNKGKGEKKE